MVEAASPAEPSPPPALATPAPAAPPTCPTCGQQTYPAGEIKPGAMLRHRFVKVETFMVLELEGDGSSGWFTARFPDMTTWRMRREEVEVITEPVRVKPPGQYL